MINRIPDFSNPLFDEENEVTHMNDMWDEYFDSFCEIDEHPLHQADGMVCQKELKVQVAKMLDDVLTESEADIVRKYFGIDCRKQSMDRLFIQYGSRAAHLISEAMEKIKYSDELLYLWKYMYR